MQDGGVGADDASRVRLCSTVTSTSSKWARRRPSISPATVITKTCGVMTTSHRFANLDCDPLVEAGITRGRVISGRTHPRPGDDVVHHSVQDLRVTGAMRAGHGHRGPPTDG